MGRKTAVEVMAARYSASQALEATDQGKMWRKFLHSDDERISLDAWKYLNDRVHGKPAQAMDVSMDTKVQVIKRVVCDL